MPYIASKDIKHTNREITQKTRRILHVLGGMNRGGIETWLMQILQHIDRDRFQMDFLVHSTEPGAYDQEARALNSQIITCPYPSRPWIYVPKFRQILREHEPYDIIHSHVHLFSGNILRLAAQAGIPCRIAHCHTDTLAIATKGGLYRRLYYTWMKSWINRYATMGLGINNQAVAALFGSSDKSNPRWQAINYGLDITPYADKIDAAALRAELGIPTDTFVIGHIGRFVEVKNHTFILDIAAAVVKREPKMRLLLVGEGSLRSQIEQKASELGLTDHVIFTGVRADVARLMRGAMDVFLFPSLFEGLGNVRLEAQCAGLPAVISDVVPQEGDVIKPLVQRLSLSESADTWAEAILTWKNKVPGINQTEALKIMKDSNFNIEKAVKQLEQIYQN
ncbi:glycosyltransferase family 1 protein [Dolichospermum circinale]|uniref:glycosyltransferase family 1 protein n=1 Tax=Dolichospermum circinale TaxID=109265 RepID=UPI0003FBF3F3|nr:glycosyltransferase family 1 protein [Dolichospermum circinale]MDB9455553.1 glycosyltransferase family 1 protein [Dolichospermum circinale CS-541/06]MDB9461684.1 glycosyltransferase family 1 protein [Dolichospermum circinale CS-541/04]MDB9475825.1 glycosyltransferase family 1 protein [Dolichospermum circinale CS-537/11]MDB9477790.1 glycosyltransferase family 1 protein [Dolichospermum circinale CS-537/03]MDB9547842.1 glycosyltransferase family 1 protein [Dolichospermum circinale CS-1031]